MPADRSTATTAPPAVGVPASAGRSLVPLLGDQRAAIVGELRRAGDASVAELAKLLGISEVATRRHLSVLEEDGLVVARTVKQGRGRPAARYSLTEDARRLFPQGQERLANEVLAFLADEHGREGVRAFLRWRSRRQVDSLRGAVTAEDLHARLEQLAAALSEAGYEASVTPDGDGFTLRQHHCAIQDVAEQHPELCAYEAAGFSQVLGDDVTVARRQTLAAGATACVCCVQPRTAEPARRASDDDTPHDHPNDHHATTDAAGTVPPAPGRGDLL